MGKSFQKTLIKNAIYESGYYHLKLSQIQKENVEELKNNRDISQITLMYNLGEAFFKEKSDSDYPYLKVYSFEDSSQIETLSFRLKEGTIPKSKNEIILNEKTMTDGNLKIGDTIHLELGTRVTRDNNEDTLNEYNPYLKNEEKLINKTAKDYTIVGVFEKSQYQYSYNYFGITVKDTSEKIDAYITLSHPKEYQKSMEEILDTKMKTTEGETEYKRSSKYETYETNSELLRWEVFAFSDSTIAMLYTVIGIVITIILITSIFCIRNSFAIATTEKMRMYGMLSSIGATKNQIKKNVIQEGLILGIIAIPLGILAGIFAVYVVLLIVNYILRDILINSSIQKIQFAVAFFPIILSVVLGFVTIYLSSISSAKKASKVSPIESLRSNYEIKIKKEKLKTTKLIQKFFKTGGVLAYKNLKRSKKKYRTTVISLTVSILIFIAMNSFIEGGFGITNQYYTDYDYNLTVNNMTKEQALEILKLNHIKTATTIYRTKKYLKITDPNKINKIEDLNYIYEDRENNANLELIALNDKDFKDYVSSLNLDYEKVKAKGILCDEYKYHIESKLTLSRRYSYQKEDIISGTWNEESLEIPIGEISSKKPNGLQNTYTLDGYLIVNKEEYSNFEFKPDSITIDSDDPDTLEKEIKNIDKSIYTYNIAESARQEKAILLVISIFLYGFITVITLIGVTNIFNTITSNMELRQKEFATLKSIGMTKKEFNRMINLETLFYSLKSLFYEIFLGLLASYMIYQGFTKKMNTPYSLPTVPIILSILFVFILVYTIMKYSMKKINKANMIETIRKENI